MKAKAKRHRKPASKSPNPKPSPATPARSDWLTIEQLASIIGASVQAIELWCSEGMPHEKAKPNGKAGRPRRLFHLATCTDWMIAHNRAGFSTPKLAATVQPIAEVSDAPGLAGAVARSRVAEHYGFQLLRAAIDKKDNFAISATLENWRELGKVLADLERRHNDRDLLTREIQEHTQQAVREWCDPKRAYIESIPQAFGPRFLQLAKLAEANVVLDELVAGLLRQLAEPLAFKQEQPTEVKR
jgi:hypothetical protein